MVALYAMQDDSGSLCDLYQTSRLEFEPCTRVTVLPPEAFPHWLESHGNGGEKTIRKSAHFAICFTDNGKKCRQRRRNAALDGLFTWYFAPKPETSPVQFTFWDQKIWKNKCFFPRPAPEPTTSLP